MRTVLVPTTRASEALRQGRAEAALEALNASTSTELGTVAGLVPAFLRGQALLMKGAPADALREDRKVLDNRGVDPFAPVVALAQLGTARARALTGDTGGSRRAYDELFKTWHAADADFGLLSAARAGYARLSPSTAPAERP